MGKARKLRIEAEETWPNLQQFLECYLHQDFVLHDGTPESAVDHAVADASPERRKIIAKEWWDWNARIGSKTDPRRDVNEGLGVCVFFKKPEDARRFMNMVYDKLIVSIRSETKGWKP